ncbi:hypothetical protein Tco_0753885 [Tanacetum coccineum]
MAHRLKIVLLKCLQSFEYLRALGENIGCAINKGIQDGMKAGIEHGKAKRYLSVIEAYDPSAVAKYVDAINALRTGEITKKHLSLTDAMIPLVEPLSSKSLIGKASTSAIPATAEPITTLSITFASSGVVPPFSISDYQVSDAEPHDKDPHTIIFEEEEVDTTPEPAVTFHVHGRMFLLWSLSLYAPFPNAYVTSYVPSHLGLSLPPSSAWLASLIR